jgi:hypothetical protein
MRQAAMQEVLDAIELAALHLIVAYTVYLHCALRAERMSCRTCGRIVRTVRSAVPVSRLSATPKSTTRAAAINNWRAQGAVQRRLRR